MRLSLLILFPALIIIVYLIIIISPEFSTKVGGAPNISNFLIVLLTYIYVVLTGQMVRKMIEIQKQDRRPYLIFDLVFEGHIVYISLKNIGKISANDISVKITPDLPTLGNHPPLSETIFKKPILFFPPGKELKSLFNVSKDILDNNKPDTYNVELIYRWEGQKELIQETSIINIPHEKYVAYTSTKDLTDIYKILEKIKNILEIRKSHFTDLPKF